MGEVVALKDTAAEIGRLFFAGNKRSYESLALYAEVGRALLAEKPNHPQDWMEWLVENEIKLGFDEWKARRMMAHAKRFDVNVKYTHAELHYFYRQLWGNVGRPSGGGGSVEWYTPSEYIEKARAVLGDIDLDPASSAHAQKTVKAKRYFTIEDDGLKQPWSGRVWLNPPYEMPAIEYFADKMIASLPTIEAAIMLSNSATDTKWFQALAYECSAVCFTKGRIRFETDEGAQDMPMQGQAFFFFGGGDAKFQEQFSSVGMIMVRP